MRNVLVAGFALVVLAVGMLVAWNQLAAETREVSSEADFHVVRRRRPLSGTSYEISERSDGDTDPVWTAPLPRFGSVLPIDELHAVVLLGPDDTPEIVPADTPEWLSDTEPEPELAPSPRPSSARYVARGDGVHDDEIEPTRLPSPEAAGICLVERGVGLRFCADTPGPLAGRPWGLVQIGGVLLRDRLITVHDTAPRVVRALDLAGTELWRTEVPGRAADVWLVDAGASVGLRANEMYYAVDVSSGALTRVTPEGASICNEAGLLVSLAPDGVLSVAGTEAPVLAERARPGTGVVGQCSSFSAEGSVLAEVRSTRAPVGDVAEPMPITDPSAPLSGGVAVYELAPDGTLRGAWALGWATSVYRDDRMRLVAAHGGTTFELDEGDGGLRLAEPIVPVEPAGDAAEATPADAPEAGSPPASP